MTRLLLCRECGDKLKPYLPLEDRKLGWSQRKVYVSLRNTLRCDACDKTIGQVIAIAVTRWQRGKVRDWEEEFGTVLDSNTVKLTDQLLK